MKKRKWIGGFTVLQGIGGLGAFLSMMMIDIPLSSMSLASFIFIGVFGFVGGILIFKGKKNGYYLTCAVWGYFLTLGFIGLVQLHTNPYVIPSLEMSAGNTEIYLKPLAASAGKIFFSCLIIFILIRDLLPTFRTESTPTEA